jgi:hypothetical protein
MGRLADGPPGRQFAEISSAVEKDQWSRGAICKYKGNHCEQQQEKWGATKTGW